MLSVYRLSVYYSTVPSARWDRSVSFDIRAARGSGIIATTKCRIAVRRVRALVVALNRALRARRARPPEVPEKGSMKEPQVHPYIGCTFGGIEVFRAARACAVISLC